MKTNQNFVSGLKQILPALFIIGLVVLALGFNGYYENKPKPQVKYKVGISQPISHPGIDIVRDGIVSGFAAAGYKEGSSISFDFQNSQGDASAGQSIAQKFANSDYDLFIPIGTGSSQSLANLIKVKPIVFATVTDPISAGLVTSKEKPGGNITGTSDMILFQDQLELLKKISPNAKKVGVVYNPSESNSQFGLNETKRIATELGLEVITASVGSTGEVYAAAQSLVSRVDAFYIISDNTVIAAQDSIIKVSLDSKKPLIAVEQDGVEKGALATVGINYFKLGERTAELAIRVLKGEKPGDISVFGTRDGDLYINTKTANAIGITIPDSLLKQAKQLYQ